MSGKSFEGTEKIIIGRYEYEHLKKKAEEFDVDIKTIIEWLVEEHLDEL
jgi:hypothetical protein